MQPSHWLRLTFAAVLTALAVACGDARSTAPAGAPATLGTSATQAAPPAGTVAPEVVASTAGTPRAQLPVVAFTTSTGGTADLPIEVPPETEYAIGLSGRRSLDERGMLFYYRQPVTYAFWMKNTHINLSIAFVDEAGRVAEVREMRAESLDLVQPASPYRLTVEAPAGWYAAHSIAAGATARFRFRVSDYLPGAEQVGGGP